MAESDLDVVIIGAGLSGLSSAKLLAKSGLKVAVLEARDRVGGRTYTIQNDKVNYVDLGGSYVGPTQNRLLRLADEYGIKTFLTNEVEDIIFHTKGITKRFKRAFPPISGFFAKLDMNNLFRLIDKMGEEIPADAPWKAPKAQEWDQMTVREFLQKNVWTLNTGDFLSVFVCAIVTSEIHECSLLWFLWYVKQCGGSDRIIATTNGGQERRFVGGSQQISKRIAADLGSEVVFLNTPVNHIEQRDHDVVVSCLNGKSFKAKHVVVAAPLPLQSKIVYDPPLPPLRNQLIQRVPMGSVIKCFVYYDRPFWKEKGFCGSTVIDDDDAIVEFTLDDCKVDGSKPAIMGFILADRARKYSALKKEERMNRVCQLYAKVFQTNDALKPVHYEEMNWMAEQWSGGCYTSMLPPGFLTNFGQELRKPVGRLFFAGTETASYWSGYMEGAVQAGERAAREILHALGRISEDEIWQEEPENNTVKARPFETTFFERNAPSVGGFLKFIGTTSLLSMACASTLLYMKSKKGL